MPVLTNVIFSAGTELKARIPKVAAIARSPRSKIRTETAGSCRKSRRVFPGVLLGDTMYASLADVAMPCAGPRPARGRHEGRHQGFLRNRFHEDLKKMDVPVLIMRCDDDQNVPIADSALLSAKFAKNATLKVYPGYPHGMATTHADVINADLLAFIRS